MKLNKTLSPRAKRSMAPQLKCLVILIIALLSNGFIRTLSAQSYVSKEWQTNYDTPVDTPAWGNSSAIDLSGNIAVTGSSDSGGYSYISTWMLGPDGSRLWHASYKYSATHNDFGVRVVLKNSYVYVAGISFSNAYDMVVIKYDLSGNQVWAYRANNYWSGINVFPLSMAVDNSDNIYVAGTVANPFAGYDVAVTKIASDGTAVWGITYDNVGLDDYATGIALGTNGEVYVSASTSTVGFGGDPINAEYMVLKINKTTGAATGVIETTPATSVDIPVGIKTDANSNVYITGNMNDGTNWNMVTIMYDSTLSRQWADTFKGSSAYNQARAIDLDGSNNIFVTGISTSEYGDRNIATIKYSSGGTQQWAQTYSGINEGDSAAPFAIDHDANGAVYVVGTISNGYNSKNMFTFTYDQNGKPGWTRMLTIDNGQIASGRDIKVFNNNDVYVMGVFGNRSTLNYTSLRYSSFVRKDTVAHDTLENAYLKHTLLVRFQESSMNMATVNNGEKTFGNLSEFITSSAQSVINAKVGFNMVGDDLNTFKVTNFTPADSQSLSRMGDTVRVPDVWTLLKITIPSDKNIYTIRDSLSNLVPVIRYASFDHIAKMLGPNTPNDSNYNLQLTLQVNATYPNLNINAERAWGYTTGDNSFNVGIVDGPADYRRQDFHVDKKTILRNPLRLVLDTANRGSYETSNAKGVNFLNNPPDSIYNEPPDEYSYYHGTAVAGIIGASRNDRTVVAGIAGGDSARHPGVKMTMLQVMDTLNDPEEASIVAAMYQGAYSPLVKSPLTAQKGLGLNILNCSFGIFPSFIQPVPADFFEVTGFAYSNGVVLSCARGNEGKNDQAYPCNYIEPWVISVSGAGSDGLIRDTTKNTHADSLRLDTYGSSFGSGVDIMAPDYLPAIITDSITRDKPMHFSGTSAAAAYVSGSAALVLSAYKKHFPHGTNGAGDLLDADDVQTILKVNATDRGATGYDDYSGYGYLNVGTAVDYCANGRVLHKIENNTMHFDSTLPINPTNAFVLSILQKTYKYGPHDSLLPGRYYVEEFLVFDTINYLPFVGGGFFSTNIWARGSKSSTVSDLFQAPAGRKGYSLMYPDLHYAKVTWHDNSIHKARIEGYVYKIISLVDAPFTIYNVYYPFDPRQSAQFGYSLYQTFTLGIPNEEKQNIESKAYPNPTKNNINLQFTLPGSGEISLDLIDVTGKETTITKGHGSVGVYDYRYNADKLAPGLYIIRLRFNGQEVTQKFVKEP